MSALPFIDIHTHRIVSVANIQAIENVFAKDIHLFENIKEGVFSVGLHPWHINSLTFEREISSISEIAASQQVLAIGETGLDKLCNVDFELQKQVFTRHLEISGNTGKPLIIHCIKAFPEIISVYQKSGSDATLIFHGFNNNISIAENLLRQGFYLSFGYALLNEKSNACQVIGLIPVDRFFLETDDSGNSIEEIYAQAARIRRCSILDLKIIVLQNFENCFKIKL